MNDLKPSVSSLKLLQSGLNSMLFGLKLAFSRMINPNLYGLGKYNEHFLKLQYLAIFFNPNPYGSGKLICTFLRCKFENSLTLIAMVQGN